MPWTEQQAEEYRKEYYKRRKESFSEKYVKQRRCGLCKNYWDFIKDFGVAGRRVLEYRVFDESDYNYINKMNKQGTNH